LTAWGTLYSLEVSALERQLRYQTDITVGRNGQEVRNALWQDPLYSYSLSHSIKTYDHIETLETLFHAVKGREQSFLVLDQGDFEAPRQTIGTGDGADTTFQLVKAYTHGVIGTYTRNITKPKALEGAGGVRIWVNNVELATSAFSFSSSTGIVTLSAAPTLGHAVEASVDEFYVPVRFDIDELPTVLLNYWVSSGQNYSNVEIPSIPLREVRGE
jgi:uncharacterized protein (TIGR02217 family)